MFVCGFTSHLRIFYSYGDITITGEGLQILTYIRPSWLLSSEGSLACHTFFDKGHPFIMIIFFQLWSVVAGIRPPTFCMRGEHSN